MKHRRLVIRSLTASAIAFAVAQAHAGSLFYVAIPATGSDAGSGLASANVYTSAVSGGNVPSGSMIGGVQFSALAISGKTATGNNVTLSAATGTFAAGGGKSGSIAADGAFGEALSHLIFNDAAENGSEQYLALDPASLESGKTYDLRIYLCNPSNQNRQVDLSFVGDGQPAVDTDFFNEDDATTSPGAFTDPNQVYYVDYRYTWDGATTPGVTVTQKSGNTPFSFYALTNQEVTAGATATPPPGAIAAAPVPRPSSPPPPTSGAIQTDVGDQSDDSSQPDVGVSSDTFYSAESLQKHGRWVEVGSYGRCWQPTGVAADWAPYSVGRWQYASDGGWTFVSDEDWGWATYHYGRWCQAGGAWCWVPGRVWAPSWCSWRFGGGHVGWAPLPPEAGFSVSIGIGGWADVHYGLGPLAYNFCATRDFGAPSISQVIVNRQQNTTLIQNTTNVTNITNYNHNVYSGGPNVTSINNTIVRAGGHPFAPVVIQRRTDGVGGKPELKGNVLTLDAPKLAAKPAALPKIAATIPAEKVDKGWGQIKDPKVAGQLKGKIAQESHGLTPQTAPARVTPAVSGKPSAVGKTGAPETPGALPGIHKPGEAVAAKTGSPGGKPAVGIQKPGQPAHQPGEAPAKPGQPAAAGEKVAKPNAPAAKPGEAPAKPGQPAAPGQKVAKPNTPAAKPGEAPATPGQPIAPGEDIAKPNPPAHKPAEPLEKPGKPAAPGEGTVKPIPPAHKPPEAIEKPGQPALAPGEGVAKPNQPVHKPAEAVEKPGRPGEPAVKPAEPERKPVAAHEKPLAPETSPAQPGARREPPAGEPVVKRPGAEPPAEKRPPVEEPKVKEPVSEPKRKEPPVEAKHAPAAPEPAKVAPREEKGKPKGKATPAPN